MKAAYGPARDVLHTTLNIANTPNRRVFCPLGTSLVFKQTLEMEEGASSEMKKLAVWMLVWMMALSLCACDSGRSRIRYFGAVREANEASEALSGTTWGYVGEELAGDILVNVILFTNGEDGGGDAEFFIQLGETNIFQVRGRYTVSKKGDHRIAVEYEEQLKDGDWGPVDEGRLEHDEFKYVMEDGEITQLYRADEDGAPAAVFFNFDDL